MAHCFHGPVHVLQSGTRATPTLGSGPGTGELLSTALLGDREPVPVHGAAASVRGRLLCAGLWAGKGGDRQISQRSLVTMET